MDIKDATIDDLVIALQERAVTSVIALSVPDDNSTTETIVHRSGNRAHQLGLAHLLVMACEKRLRDDIKTIEPPGSDDPLDDDEGEQWKKGNQDDDQPTA